MKSVHVNYKGYVQGVGFRFTTVHIARRFEVTGFVRNLADGSVEMLAEGTDDELQRFLKDIDNSPLGRHIRDKTVSFSTATGQYSSFGVSY